MKIYLVLIFLCLLNTANAQYYILGGPSYSHVRNNNLLQGQQDPILLQAGTGLRITPFIGLQKLDMNFELLVHHKGYHLQKDSIYDKTFWYLALPVYATYSPFNFFSLYSGAEFSLRVDDPYSHNDDMFNEFDVGVILGTYIFDNKRFAIYTRLTYGLLPMLQYYVIDEWGNFAYQFNDLMNTTIAAGIRINLYNEKIRTYNSSKNRDPVDAAARVQW